MTEQELKKWFESIPLVDFLFIGRDEPLEPKGSCWYDPNHQRGLYSMDGFNCCLLSRVSAKSFEQLYEFASCRSWTTDIIQAYVNGQQAHNFNMENMKHPSMNYLLQGITGNNRALHLGLVFVTAMEKYFNVKNPTQLWRASVPNKRKNKPNVDILIAKADQQFVTNPFLTNMYQLMWKLANTFTHRENYDSFIKDGKPITDLVKIIEKMKFLGVGKYDNRNDRFIDGLYIRRNVLNKLVKRVFPKTVIWKGYYTTTKEKNYRGPIGIPDIHSTAGIGNLCHCTTFDEEFNKFLEKFYDTHCKKKKATKKKGELLHERRL